MKKREKKIHEASESSKWKSWNVDLCNVYYTAFGWWCAWALTPSVKGKNAFTHSWMDANIRNTEWRHFKNEQVRVRCMSEWMNEPTMYKPQKNKKRFGFVMTPTGCIIFTQQTMQLHAFESMNGKRAPARVQFSFSFYAHRTFFRATLHSIDHSCDILDVC